MFSKRRVKISEGNSTSFSLEKKKKKERKPIPTVKNELGHSIFYKTACVPSEDPDQLVHLHQSHHCLFEDALGQWLPTGYPVKTDQSAQMCRLI